MFNALNSLTICISSSHSSNPRLASLETLIPNNHSVWMRKGSYGWVFALFSPWFNSFDLCKTLHALDASLSCICPSCISLYALFWLFLHLILSFFVWVKIYISMIFGEVPQLLLEFWSCFSLFGISLPLIIIHRTFVVGSVFVGDLELECFASGCFSCIRTL